MKARLPEKQIRLLVILSLAALTFFVYGETWNFEFIHLDDPAYVTQNTMVRDGITWQGVQWAFSTFSLSNWHPLTWLSFMVDRELFGEWAGGPHLLNAALHALNAVLLFYALGSMTGCWVRSAAVAALFAVHPLHLESVAWVSARKDVLSTFFWMLTMVAYSWYVRSPKPGRYLAVAASLGAGLMAKQMLVTLPFVLLLLDYWPLRRWGRAANAAAGLPISARPSPAGVLLEKGPLIGISLVFSGLIYSIQSDAGSLMTGASFPVSVRLGNALLSYVAYLGKTVWPVNLSVFYPHPGAGIEGWKVSASLALLLVLTAIALVSARRRPFLAVGWFWYVGTLFPVIGVVQTGWQAMADRYTYIPLIGIFIVVSWALPDARRASRAAKTLLAAALAVLLALTLMARWQVRYWQTSEMLFSRALEVTTSNFVAHYMLGEVLVEKGDFDSGIAHLGKFLRLRPDLDFGYLALGDALAKAGRNRKAVAAYEQALALRRNYPEAHNNLGILLLRMGELNSARQHFSATLALKSHNANAHANLGAIMLIEGRLEDAESHFLKALATDPGNVAARRNLVFLYRKEGRTADAELHERELDALDSPP